MKESKNERNDGISEWKRQKIIYHNSLNSATFDISVEIFEMRFLPNYPNYLVTHGSKTKERR